MPGAGGRGGMGAGSSGAAAKSLSGLDPRAGSGVAASSGVVGIVNRERKTAEVSIGLDDGAWVGQMLHIYRLTPKPMYIGQAQVTDAAPDRATISFSSSQVATGDHVASRLPDSIAAGKSTSESGSAPSLKDKPSPVRP